MKSQKSEAERLKSWKARLESSRKVTEKWEKRFRCTDLEQYYEGFQWDDNLPSEEGPRDNHYTINLVFPTIETIKSGNLYYNPVVKVQPRPAKADDPGSDVDERAKLQQDVVNTFIQDPDRKSTRLNSSHRL